MPATIFLITNVFLCNGKINHTYNNIRPPNTKQILNHGVKICTWNGLNFDYVLIFRLFYRLRAFSSLFCLAQARLSATNFKILFRKKEQLKKYVGNNITTHRLIATRVLVGTATRTFLIADLLLFIFLLSVQQYFPLEHHKLFVCAFPIVI